MILRTCWFTNWVQHSIADLYITITLTKLITIRHGRCRAPGCFVAFLVFVCLLFLFALFCFCLMIGWGGVGWDVSVHVHVTLMMLR